MQAHHGHGDHSDHDEGCCSSCCASEHHSHHKLSVEELQRGLSSLLPPNEAFSANEVSQLVVELDMNGDGEFDMHELSQWINKHSREDSEHEGIFGFGIFGF